LKKAVLIFALALVIAALSITTTATAANTKPYPAQHRAFPWEPLAGCAIAAGFTWFLVGPEEASGACLTAWGSGQIATYVWGSGDGGGEGGAW